MKRSIFASMIMVLTLIACGAAPSASVPPTITLAQTAVSVPTVAPSATAQPGQDVVPKIEAFLNKMVKQDLFSGSVLIVRDGAILVSNGYGLADREKQVSNTAQTKFRLGSITKQFTAIAILILQSQGKLNVQDPICKYISDCPTTWQPITIHQLLTHTSGIPDFVSFPDYQTTKQVPSSPAQTMARFRAKPLDFKPGEKWSYSNSGYIVLGNIIERVTGKSYEAFLQEHIFAPVKMVDTGYDHNKNILATGYASKSSKADAVDMSIPYAAGGLYSTVEDMYRWDQVLDTEQLVPKELLDKIFTAAVPVPDADGFGYGYGWFIDKQFNQRRNWHDGAIEGFHNFISRYPDSRVSIILLSNREDTNVEVIEKTLAQIVFGEK